MLINNKLNIIDLCELEKVYISSILILQMVVVFGSVFNGL